ncbi:MAG: O-antigen ligase family protein [Betaproteobacteria bacterium]|nr:O-antigen ligase family protein [Betaproteobacteria bacterium]
MLPVGLMIGNAAAEVVAGLLVILFILHTLIHHEWAGLKQDWVLILLVLWGYGVLRALFSDHAASSLLNALGWLRFILLAVALQVWVLPHRRWRQALINVGLLTMTWLAGDAVFQYIHGSDVFGHIPQAVPLRLTASYGKTIVGIMLAWQYLPYVLADFERGKSLRALALAGLCLIAITLSGERMALLFSLFSIGLLVLSVPKLRRTGIALGLSLVVIAGSVMLLKPQLYERQVTSTLAVIKDVPNSSYGQLWRSALDISQDHPVFGVGMGNFNFACPDPRYGGNVDIRCAPHPHNIYLQWLSEGGLIALLGFIAAMSLVMRHVWRYARKHRDNYLVMGLAVTLVARLWPLASSTSFFHGWAAIPFWMMLGWVMAEIDVRSVGK